MRALKKTLLTTLVLLLALVASVLTYLWLTLLSPYGYDYPEAMAPEATEAGHHRVFVYGTLRYAPVRWIVTGRAGDPEPYTLEGYRKKGLDIKPAPGEEVEGMILTVSVEELRRLDRYERLGVHYRREPITLEDGRKAWVYQLME